VFLYVFIVYLYFYFCAASWRNKEWWLEMGRNKILMVGKKSGTVLSRLWTKVHEILGQCRCTFVPFVPLCTFVLSSALARLTMSCFVQKIFAIKCRSRRKPEQMLKFFAPSFFLRGRPQLFYSRMLARFTVRRLAKCGWVLFADLRLRSLAMT